VTARRTTGAIAVGVAQLGLQLSHTAALAAALPGPGADPYPPALTGRAVTPPNPDGWYRGPVPVRWTASDGWSGLAVAPPDLQVEGEGEGLVAAGTAFDRAGNHRSVRLRPALRIDLTAPVTSLEAPPGWASTDRTVALAATDNLSGVAGTWWRVDGGRPQSGDQVALPGPGDHTLQYWSVDRAGNPERPHTVLLPGDGRAPEVTHRVLPAGTRSDWHRSPVRVVFRCAPGDAPVVRCPAPVRVGRQGTTVLAGTAVDRAGRQAADPVTVSIDAVDPVLAVRADHAPGRSGWYGEPLTLTFSCWDAGSGIPPGGCPGPVTVPEGAGREVTVRAADVAGNAASLTVQGLDVDTTAPVSHARAEQVTRAGRVLVRVRLRGTDALSGVAGTWYRLDDGPTLRLHGAVTVAQPGEHRLTWWTVDRAGNVEGGARGRRTTVLVPGDGSGSTDPTDPPTAG
jgi:large repetitive protein